MVTDATQTDISLVKIKYDRNEMIRKHLEMIKKKKEIAFQKKQQEQREVREMLERYWPWSNGRVQPRGYKNLRLDELFPNNDYQKSKRMFGVVDREKPIKIKEDPLLRFQFTKELRQAVDNNLRYKLNKKDQELYKKQLDMLVEEKNRRKMQEKRELDESLRKQGWSNTQTLAALKDQSTSPKCTTKYRNNNRNNNIVKLDPIDAKKLPDRKLTQLSNLKDNGVELVTLLAKDRKYPLKIPLTTTDITSDEKLRKLWNREGSAYLRDLTCQIRSKQQWIKKIREEENENVKKHFSTWDTFWGRPGNGAPLPEIKKQCLDQLLYPKMFPTTVH